MIVDLLEHAADYAAMSERIGAGFEFLRKTDWQAMEPGRYGILGDDVFAIVSVAVNQPAEQPLFEAHRAFIDIQFVAEGEEKMGYAAVGSLTPASEYHADKDYQLFHGQGDEIIVRSGMFALFAPQDGHMPGLPAGMGGIVKKAVVKVRV